MADGNGATVHVHFAVGDFNFVDGVNGLGCKGLVDLIKIDVVLGQANLLQNVGNGISRPHTHDPRWDANHRCCNVLAEDRKAKVFGNRTASKNDCCGAIGDL